MRGNHWKKGAFIAALLASAAAAGCAQDIGDIDRTEPNRVKKSDLTEGAWFMHQKIVDMPGTTSSYGMDIFEGLMMDTDKVVFVAEENYLMAYRSYPILPGADGNTVDGANNIYDYDELYGDDYKGSVRAMFPIKSHFDVQRSYDTTTGEQSNVIMENTTDRPWYEREYMRVAWEQNPLVNLEWLGYYGIELELGTSGETPNSPEGSPYFEYDESGELVYFDAPTRYIVQPNFYNLLIAVMGWGWYDYRASEEIRVVTSFAKDLGTSEASDKGRLNFNYEPLDYSNYDMNRFGYFRTERMTYDPTQGMMNKGRIELANRHNIWEAAYDPAGNVINMENRLTRTIPYYIHDGVKEPLMAAMAEQVIDEWNVAFKRVAWLTQNHATSTVKQDPVTGTPIDLATSISYEVNKQVLSDQQDIYVPCHIPVAANDHPVCGEQGYVPREGDFRKNFLWLVNQRQDVGLLGYCPSSTDPLTGMTISAQAHVYTAPMNEIAADIIDHLKYAKGELTPEGVRENDANVARARASRNAFVESSKLSDKVRAAKITSKVRDRKSLEKETERNFKRKSLRQFNHTAADNILKKAIDTGLMATELDTKLEQSVAIANGLNSTAELTDEMRETASLFNALSFQNRKTVRELKNAMSADGFCFKEEVGAAAYDIVYDELVEKYKDRSDYENIFNEVRAQVFRATALHEMGHGFGLRHNHSGSYDSMNYFDKYWELRRDDNFMKDKIETVGDMYALYDYSDAQRKGGMLRQQYSSIMDYSSGYLTDNMGLGKYDHAAILYAYSAGTNASGLNPNEAKNTCNGLVEVFNDGLPPEVEAIIAHEDSTGIGTFDDQVAISQNYLELVHYHDIFQPMFKAGFDPRKERHLVRMESYLDSKNSANPMVRVPYLFCTDDNRGALRSCHVFDFGADYMEQVGDLIRSYTTGYWFRNFARGRAYWDSWNVVMSDFNKFLYLSDYFQSSYVGDRSVLDDIIDSDDWTLNDQIERTAWGASFNFIANAISTPEYGTFCKRKDNGSLFGLSAEDEAAEETSMFYRMSYCGDDPDYYYVRQGEGRRRYQKYDVSMGFDYSMYDLEVAHNYTSIYAIMALFDNEANIIADTGDLGTYTLGMYDYFRSEAINLTNGMYSEDYAIHSPILVSDDGNGNPETTTYNGDEMVTGHLVYPALTTSHFYIGDDANSVEYDPLTGMLVSDFNKYRATTPLLGVCSDSSECIPVDGASFMYCGDFFGINENGVKTESRCHAVFDVASSDVANPSNPGSVVKCPSGTKADLLSDPKSSTLEYICTPSGSVAINNIANYNQLASWEEANETQSKVACSVSYPVGACAGVQSCFDGVCKDKAPIVESATSLTQKVYGTYFAMILTGYIGMDSTFYDQLNIYRVGSGEEVKPAAGYKAVTFENPFTGEVYAANERDCSDPDNFACDVNNELIIENGGAKMIRAAAEKSELLQKYYEEFMDIYYDMSDEDFENTEGEKYKKYMELNYKWSMAKYDLEYAIRDINFIRSIYQYYATLW